MGAKRSQSSAGVDIQRPPRRLIRAMRDQVLPGPTVDAWGWLLAARCRGEDIDVFFSRHGERPHAAELRHQRAATLCAQCPISVQCRDYALTYREPWGTWGGLSESQRRLILDRRNQSQL
jgi:WhiB family redox-sensing transcriptional regulator